MRIREFLSFLPPFEPDWKPNSINDIITGSTEHGFRQGKRKTDNARPAPGLEYPPVLMDFAQIEQVLLNLIGNAFAAMSDGGTLRITSSQEKDGAEKRIEVAIETAGRGFPGRSPSCISAFFHDQAHGTGMGLSTSKKLSSATAETSGRRKFPWGAKFVFWIPVTELKDDEK